MNRLASDLELIAANTQGLWDELRGQRLFITGGTGFFGCWLVESFCFVNHRLGLGAKATILTRNPEVFAKKCPHLASDTAVTLQAGDVRRFLFPEGEYAYVIHAATEASAKQATEAPLEMLSTIIAGTERTLEFAVTHGTRKFLLTSSGAVYGKQPANVTHIPESYAGAADPVDPASVYAEGKRAAELLCALYQKTEPRRLQNCALLGFLRSVSSPRPALCHRQLHWGRSCRQANSDSRRRNPKKILFVCCRPGRVALDNIVSGASARAFQCGVSA